MYKKLRLTIYVYSWDNLYTSELSNHSANPSDIGTVWFDDSDAEAKIIDFLSESASALGLSQDDTSFLDLGCGNGSLLFTLREEAWNGRALGVDYSAQSVALAKQVAESKQAEAEDDEETHPVEFSEWDVLHGPYPTVLTAAQTTGWDVVLDKGTFDAISLSASTDADGRRPCEGYRGRVLRLVRPGGLFLVTSCNWTEAELKGWFEGPQREGEDGAFEVVDRVEYRTFSFGGVKGQTISTLCFRRI